MVLVPQDARSLAVLIGAWALQKAIQLRGGPSGMDRVVKPREAKGSSRRGGDGCGLKKEEGGRDSEMSIIGIITDSEKKGTSTTA